MRLFWTLRSLPELNHLDEQQKREVIRASMTWRHHLRMSMKVLLGATFFGMLPGSYLARGGDPWVIVITIMLSGAVAGLFVFQLEMANIRRSLRRFLFDHFRGKRLPVCLRCGYDLTDNQTDRCPECGANVVMPEK